MLLLDFDFMHIVSCILETLEIINWHHYQLRYFRRIERCMDCKYQILHMTTHILKHLSLIQQIQTP